jgi:nitroreductase
MSAVWSEQPAVAICDHSGTRRQEGDWRANKIWFCHRTGACIQNMLLAAHGLGLGALWLGEIIKNADAVRALLGLPGEMKLMSVVTIGHPTSQKRSSSRKAVSQILLKER